MTDPEHTACSLADRDCLPCRGGTPALKGRSLDALAAQLGDHWAIVDEHHLTRTFTFRNFREALSFTDRVGQLAETVGHHPDIHLSWGKVTVELHTHKINGLAEADVVLAAKIGKLDIP